MWIEVAVRNVVHHATGCSHQHHPGCKYQAVLQGWLASTRQQQRPPGRPQQQQDADRLVFQLPVIFTRHLQFRPDHYTLF